MKLYFSPLACSLSSRIALYEANANVTFVEVYKSKSTSEGGDYRAVNPLGLVPLLVLDDGAVLTENAAILQYIAEAYPDAGLLPRDAFGRARLRQWLSFIGTELHKSLYVPLLDPKAPEGAKEYALSKGDSKLEWLDRSLEGRDYLLGTFSVADAYLFAVLNWSAVTPVDLSPRASLTRYQARLLERPSVARAFAEEKDLYLAQIARDAAQPVEPRV